jgi:hypothetical protein
MTKYWKLLEKEVRVTPEKYSTAPANATFL